MNKPVAWMTENGTIFDELPPISGGLIPLYTHPVKEPIMVLDGNRVYSAFKELTDEEIRHIQAMCHLKDVGYDNFIMRFARAILRKAQEK